MLNSKSYYHSIDTLRGIAALLICLFHFINHQDETGFLISEHSLLKEFSSFLPPAVFVFFLLSGFVITASLSRRNFHLKNFFSFLTRRWLRMEIPYIASILIYLFISFAWSVYGHTTFSVNLERFLHHLIYSTHLVGLEWYNEIYWTLAIEFQFYILIALLFTLIVNTSMWMRYSILFALAVSAFIFQNNGLVFHYLPFFLLGIVLYLQQDDLRFKDLNRLILFLLIIQISFSFGELTAIYVALAVFLIAQPMSATSLFSRFGKISFSFYLLHGAIGGNIIYFGAKYIHGDTQRIFLVVVAIVFSILGSLIFYRFVEKPALHLSKLIEPEEKRMIETKKIDTQRQTIVSGS